MRGHQSKSSQTAKNQTLGGFCETCGGTGRTETGCQSCPICTKSNASRVTAQCPKARPVAVTGITRNALAVPNGQRIGNGALDDMHNYTEKEHAESGCTDYLQHSADSCPHLHNESQQETAERIASEAVSKIQRFIGTTDEKTEHMHAAILVAIYEGQLATLASVKESIK